MGILLCILSDIIYSEEIGVTSCKLQELGKRVKPFAMGLQKSAFNDIFAKRISAAAD